MAEKDEPNVHQAYALETPEDSKRLYASWASTYDRTFAEKTGFAMPDHVAELFRENGGRGPVLDAGAGTGLVAGAILRAASVDIDAFDISAEMLTEARDKGFYHALYEGDLMQTLPFADKTYQSIVSAGTFTHGHVGPEALDELIRVGASGALYVLTIKKDHFVEKGFEKKFQDLEPQLCDFTTEMRPIYVEEDGTTKDTDQGLIVIFRKS